MAKRTIYDIAKEADVSIATVSRVMNNSKGIADKTREKVLRVADDLGYHPQAYAQGLARKKKNIIMVLVPVLSNYFFMEVLAGIQDEMANTDYDLNIFNLRNDGKNEMFDQVDDIIKKGAADGYIFISTHMRDHQYKHLLRYEIPIGLIDDEFSEVDSVSVNNKQGIQKAMRHFFEQGYERIGMISALKSSKPGEQRIKEFKKEMEQAGLPVDEQLIVTGDSMYRDGFSEQNGYEAMLKLLDLENPPQACFCSSDIQAFGALKAMKERGEEIPIIGYDDITISNFVGLSTIHQPMYEMGAHAIRRLLERMEQPDKKAERKVFSPELILRSSCCLNGDEN